jgi:hypothetical protein
MSVWRIAIGFSAKMYVYKVKDLGSDTMTIVSSTKLKGK